MLFVQVFTAFNWWTDVNKSIIWHKTYTGEQIKDITYPDELWDLG